MNKAFYTIAALCIGTQPSFASDSKAFPLRASQSDGSLSGKVNSGGGRLVGTMRRMLIRKAADDGAWTLWKLEAMDTILRAYNERNEQFGRPMGCTKFRITVQRSGLKTAKFKTEVLTQRGDPKVAHCFENALHSVEAKDMHYPSLLYGRTYQFVFDVCANGEPLSLGHGCL
jgi:hypothetical protein